MTPAEVVATLRGEEVTEVDGAGTNTLVTTGTLTVNLTSLPQGFRLRLDCELVDADDAVIDTFAGVTATTTAAPSATPTRPALVQTDFAGGDHPSALPFLLVGVVLAGAAAGTLRVRGAARCRRH